MAAATVRARTRARASRRPLTKRHHFRAPSLSLVTSGWDSGYYFDARPDAPPLFHFRSACLVGSAIPEADQKFTRNRSDLGGMTQCSECGRVT